MTSFENVTIQKNANVYFDGGVTSRTVQFANGEIKTLGIMLPGEYTFNTDKKELIELLAGEVEVLLPGETGWQTFGEGEAFEVKGDASFQIKVCKLTDYCCYFVDE